MLNAIGLHSYNMWEIAKKTNAVSYNDHYWMSTNIKDKFVYNDEAEDFFPSNEPIKQL